MSQSGKLKDDLNKHFDNRFDNSINFLYFVRENRIAPTAVKLNVLQACVTSTLLYNCETFADKIPKDLEIYYFKFLRVALAVRSNTPYQIMLVESNIKHPKAIIRARQLKFYRRFKNSLRVESTR